MVQLYSRLKDTSILLKKNKRIFKKPSLKRTPEIGYQP